MYLYAYMYPGHTGATQDLLLSCTRIIPANVQETRWGVRNGTWVGHIHKSILPLYYLSGLLKSLASQSKFLIKISLNGKL